MGPFFHRLMELLMSGHNSRMPLDNVAYRRQIQVELAHGTMTQQEIANKYGATQPAVSLFAKKYADTIQAIRDDALNEFAGITLAKKAARLEAYQELFAIALAATPKISPSGKLVTGTDGATVMEIDSASAARVLKQIAEELGHLPTRLQVSGEVGLKTNYTIEGVTMGDLT